MRMAGTIATLGGSISIPSGRRAAAQRGSRERLDMTFVARSLVIAMIAVEMAGLAYALPTLLAGAEDIFWPLVTVSAAFIAGITMSVYALMETR